MPVATKIIPFPRRAKPRTIEPKSRIAEFAQLSEIIRDKRSGGAIKRNILAASAVDGVVPDAPTWPQGR